MSAALFRQLSAWYCVRQCPAAIPWPQPSVRRLRAFVVEAFRAQQLAARFAAGGRY
ncbi:hypothetical protein HP532_04330 [Pseudomonas sp. CrR25]|nr:hypothetical protein [Pseudomonas sp. CrR25]